MMKETLFNQQSRIRGLRLVLALFAIMLSPIGAWAQNVTAKFLEYDEETEQFIEKTCTDGVQVTSSTSSWSNSTYVVNEDVTITERIEISGNVSLILCDGKTLTAKRGITVGENKTLTIFAQSGGTGTLIASALNEKDDNNNNIYVGAAIGGTHSVEFDVPQTIYCGRINIHGGQITADASNQTITPSSGLPSSDGGVSAGIGGSFLYGGTVAIYGGTVNAIGCENGHGIGSGLGSSDPGILELGKGVTCYGGDSENPTGNAVSGYAEDVGTRYRYMRTTYEPTKYNIWIAGTQVTSLNASNITGQYISGKVYYDVQNGLTLENATIDGNIVTSSDDVLWIGLIGTNNFVTNVTNNGEESADLYVYSASDNLCSLTITGNGNETLLSGFNNDITEALFREGGMYWLPTISNNVLTSLVIASEPFDVEETTDPETSGAYLIKYPSDLKNLSTLYNSGTAEGLVTAKFKLANDIDCSSLTDFVPIGTAEVPFCGEFYGDGHKIIGLSFTNPASNSLSNYRGLFGVVGGDDNGSSECIVDNVEMNNCSFGGGTHNGAIAGLFQSGTISNCKVTGNTTINCEGENSYAGAILGVYDGGVLSNNTYEYSVTTSIKMPNEEADVKSDYDERGLGYPSDDCYDITADNGIVMYTKKLDVSKISYGYRCDKSYDLLSNDGILALAPGQTSYISLLPEEGENISSVSLVYTPEGASVATTVPLENIAEMPGSYVYAIEMPDVDATLSVNTEYYGINVGGVAVTNINANNIMGGDFALASYDKLTNTLTLNGCQFFIEAGDAAGRGFVEIGSEIKKLNVHLLGYNVISDNFGYLFKADNEESACTVNVTTGAIPGKLVYSGDHLTSNVTLNYGNSGLTWNDKVELKAIEYAQGTEDICYFGTGQFHDDGGSLFDDYPLWDYSAFSEGGFGWYYAKAKTTNFDSNLSPTVLSELVEGQYVSKMRTDGSYLIGSLTFQCVPVVSEAAITVKLMSLNGETEYATGTLTDGVVTLIPSPAGLATFENVCLTFSSTAPFSFVPMAVKTEAIVPESSFEFHNGWTTYYNADADIFLPANVAAYIVTGVGANTAIVSQIKYVPKGIPVLLNQQNESVASTDNINTSNNMLKHAADAINDVSTLNGTVFGLYNGSFMRVTGSISAGKNYLYIPNTAPNGAPQLTIEFENDDNMTGISDAKCGNDNGQNDEWYTLNGQKLQQEPAVKGLYIKNGKKVVVNNK